MINEIVYHFKIIIYHIIHPKKLQKSYVTIFNIRVITIAIKITYEQLGTFY